MIDRLRLFLALVIIVPVTLIAAPAQYLAVRWFPTRSHLVPMAWHRMVLRLIGMRVVVKGNPELQRPLLMVANHISWIDIPVLGGTTPLSFIAKREVNEMPVANLLARLQRTVFVTREDRRGSVEQARAIAGRMAGGDAMVLFAEGTTGDGHRVQPFKSSLFGAAQFATQEEQTATVWIQPVAIAYTRLHGMPLGRYHQSEAAWPGDVPMASHALNLLTKGAYDVEVTFGKPVAYNAQSKRRDIATRTRNEVRRMFTASMRQREIPGSQAEQ